jgi:hypothetical protein
MFLSFSYVGSINRRIEVQASLGISARSSLKNKEVKWVWSVAQVVEYLPSKHKV